MTLAQTVAKRIDCAVLEELIAYGVTDFCIAPGKRNSSFVSLLKHESTLNLYYFNDERCAAFFALGRSRRTRRPTAVIVTSGTAVAHLLPAAMEAYYTHVPLVLLTADRPRLYRGTNAPQSAEQLGIFGQYAPCQLDVADGESVDLSSWDRCRPLHLNACLEEPKPQTLATQLIKGPLYSRGDQVDEGQLKRIGDELDLFLHRCRFPFVSVGTLREDAREAVAKFLLNLCAPVYLESVSGLREDRRLATLSISCVDKLWQYIQKAHYPIDGVLRIGGAPTPRYWRDLEEREGQIEVFSINEEPFSCLSWGPIACAPLKHFFGQYQPGYSIASEKFAAWKAFDRELERHLQRLYAEEPTAEPSLIYALSNLIPQDASLFLGNSLPIRYWNMAASRSRSHNQVWASRGLNGIDGQLSTFLGLSRSQHDNWAILGDLTALHDLGGWWILPQLDKLRANVVVVNNGGGRIFQRMQLDKEIQNEHSIGFEPVAALWGIPYQRWTRVPEKIPAQEQLLIELVPDEEATKRFWDKFGAIG